MEKPEISKTTFDDIFSDKSPAIKKTNDQKTEKAVHPEWIRIQEGFVWVATREFSQREKSKNTIDAQKACDFYVYFKQWKKETAGLSSPRSIRMNRNYQKIIGLGESVLPLILAELQREPNDWLYALEMIAKDEENPVTDEMGFKESLNAWINWGKTKGYL
jgi:hypothetical protein